MANNNQNGEYSKEYEERMTSDLGLKLLTEEKMVCAKCKHCQGDVLSCAIYAQKPDSVLDGDEPCIYATPDVILRWIKEGKPRDTVWIDGIT